MAKVRIDTRAPGFSLKDWNGNNVSLTDFESKKHVVLIFNRGFK